MIYNYVIVLCASPLNKDKFDELSSDGSYLGGQVRMQAAVDFYFSKRVRKFIIIGGGMEKSEKIKKWEKVEDMRTFLINKNVPAKNISGLCSDSDTHGNLRAVYKEFNKEFYGKTVGILSNFYHLPRVMRFAQDPQFKWKVNLIPICAESVIISMPPNYLQFVQEFLFRISNEIRGLKNWEESEYRDQFKPEEDWAGEVL